MTESEQLPDPVEIPGDYVRELASEVPKTFRSMPKLSEPGPLGMRKEHWISFMSNPEYSAQFSLLIAHLALGAIDKYSLSALKKGQVAPLPKGDNDVRPLLLSQFVRRLALRSLMRKEK